MPRISLTVVVLFLSSVPVTAMGATGYLDTSQSASLSTGDHLPDPEMTISVPSAITIGESFTIRVDTTNEGGWDGTGGKYSTISISSPSIDSKYTFSDVSTSLDSVNRFSQGEEIFEKNGDRINAEYALLEAGTGDGTWEVGEDNYLSAEITPDETGTMILYVRTTLTNDEDVDVKYTDPESPDTYDQQNFPVRRVEVKVEPETREYELDVDADRSGDVEIEPPGDITPSYFDSYEEDTRVELTARPDPGYVFEEWEGDVDYGDQDDSSITVTMDQARSITATFDEEITEYDLITDVEGQGEVAINGRDFKTSGTYEEGTLVDLTAQPDDGYTFSGWEGDVDYGDQDDSSITVTMNQARSITATFNEEVIEYDLTTDVEGQGEVAINGRAFKTSGTYEEGTLVDLTVQPDDGYTFSGWEGDVDYGDQDDSSITVTMDQARSITATFDEETTEYELTTDVEGQGEVAINGRDFKTGDTYKEGTRVDLTAQPDDGYTFSGWVGDVDYGDQDDSSITVTMDQARSVTATFDEEITEYDLTTDVEGQGEVAINGRDLKTGDTYEEGTRVDLTAQPDDGYTFSGWVGDVDYGDQDDSSITVTMDQARSITATFEPSEGPPSVEFDISTQSPQTGEQITFDATRTTDDARVTEYDWTIGGSDQYSGEVVSHTFEQPGKYTVTLIATDIDSYTESESRKIAVQGTISVDINCESIGARSIECQATSDGDGEVESYKWNLTGEPGYQAHGQEIEYTFDTGDKVTASVTATGAHGSSDTARQTLELNEPPNAAFTYSPETPLVGETITFNAEESTDNGRIIETEWDLGSSEPIEKEGAVTTHTFDQPGEKAVEVTVQDDDGATDTLSRSVNVRSPAFTEMTIRQQPDEANEPASVTVSATSQLGNQPIRIQLFISVPDEMTVAGFNLPPDWSNGQSATVVTDEPLEPGESAEIGMNVAAAANGTYTVTGEAIYLIGDEKRKVGPVPLDPVQMTVGTVATETAAPQTTIGEGGPGFGIPVTVLVVILLGLRMGRYRQ